MSATETITASSNGGEPGEELDRPAQPPRLTELKLITRSSAGSVHVCECSDSISAPAAYFESVRRRLRKHPHWSDKRIVVVKRRLNSTKATAVNGSEVEILRASQTHPHVITLFEAFIDSDSPSSSASSDVCLVFEQMEGTLAQLIKSRKHKHMAEGLVSSVVQQIASGLAHVHSQGYAHLALSPDHILVTTTGLEDYRSTPSPAFPSGIRKDVAVNIKVAGFGHAAPMSVSDSSPHQPQQNAIIGPYTAPELLVFPQQSPSPSLSTTTIATDMWSLGTICHELMTLKPLCTARGWKDLFVRWCSIIGPPTREPSRASIEAESMDPCQAPDAVDWAERHGLGLSSFAVVAPYFGDVRDCDSSIDFGNNMSKLVSRLITWNTNTRLTAEDVADSSILRDPRYAVLAEGTGELPSPTPLVLERRPNTAPSEYFAPSQPEEPPYTPYVYAPPPPPDDADADTISLAPTYRSRANLLSWRSTSSLPLYDASPSPSSSSRGRGGGGEGGAGDLFSRALNSDTPINASVLELCAYLRQLPIGIAEQDRVVQLVRRREVGTSIGNGNGNGITRHEFVLLECTLSDKGSVWIRLERLEKVKVGRGAAIRARLGSAGGGSSSLSSSGSSSNSKPNDIATLAYSGLELFDKDTSVVASRIHFHPSPSDTDAEHEQGRPTLLNLAKLLECVEAEAGLFRSWPDNRLFFCSVIEELLGSSGSGTRIEGSLEYASLGAEFRKRIKSRYLAPTPSPDSSSLSPISPTTSTSTTLRGRMSAAEVHEERAAAMRAAKERARNVVRKLESFQETPEFKAKSKWGQIGPGGNFVSYPYAN